MRVLAILMLVCAVMLPQLGLAGTDSAAGKAVYRSGAVCHGAGDEGTALKALGLTHLGPIYIVSQLDKFRTACAEVLAPCHRLRKWPPWRIR